MLIQAGRCGVPLALVFMLIACPGKPNGPDPDRPRRAVENLTPLQRLQHEVSKGAAEWRKSCPVTPVDGLCVTARAKPGHWTFKPRNEAAVARAREHLERAWATFETMRKRARERPREETRTIVAAAAQAKYLLAELGLEAYFQQAFPKDIEMNPAQPEKLKQDVARFKGWLRSRLSTHARLGKAYIKVVSAARLPVGGKKIGSARWSMAALYRSALLYHQFGETLASVPVPASLTVPEARQAWTAQLTRFAAPLLAKARARYGICIKFAGALKVPAEDPWLRRCVQEQKRLGK